MKRARVVFVLLYVAMIFYLSSRPYLHAPGPEFALRDKVAHCIEYGILGVLLWWGIGFTVSRSRPVTFLFLLAVGLSIAALDEMFQGYFPGRHTDITDWIADGVGLALALGFSVRRARRRAPLGGRTGGAA